MLETPLLFGSQLTLLEGSCGNINHMDLQYHRRQIGCAWVIYANLHHARFQAMGRLFDDHRRLLRYNLLRRVFNSLQPSLSRMEPCSTGFMQISNIVRVFLHRSQSGSRHGNHHSPYAMAIQASNRIKSQAFCDGHVQFRLCVSAGL